jgi:hypothetical protein
MERRAELRIPIAGPVRLLPEGPLGKMVEGSVVDISAGGFRATHNCSGLSTGQIVSFQHLLARGRARVIWTRISGEQVESGFHYMEAES